MAFEVNFGITSIFERNLHVTYYFMIYCRCIGMNEGLNVVFRHSSRVKELNHARGLSHIATGVQMHASGR